MCLGLLPTDLLMTVPKGTFFSDEKEITFLKKKSVMSGEVSTSFQNLQQGKL